ncbi:MAG: DUF5060 domain-containing protein [Planctomycetota bacterium]|jgi:hypothetical protein
MCRSPTTTVSTWLGFLGLAVSPVAVFAGGKLAIEASAKTVGQYEKIEFLIDVDAKYRNPFDPDEVEVSLVVESPGGRTLRVPAFYCQRYERRELEDRRQRTWMYPSGEPVWTARFAPMELGRYRAAASLTDQRGTRQSGEVAFACTPSARKGFLRVSRRDPRFFELSEGEPFFAVGQNLAFIGQGQYVKLAKAEEIFAQLAENGANYLRIWTCCKDWAMAIEARKSAWGRSWHWKPPFGAMPDDDSASSGRRSVRLPHEGRATVQVSPSHDVALKPSTRYVLSGRARTEGGGTVHVEGFGAGLPSAVSSGGEGRWTPFERSLETAAERFWLGRLTLRLEGSGTAWVDALSLQEAGGGPELLWEAAVNRPVRGYYNPIDCFMLDQIVEAAEKHGIYLQLCLITRDLYMEALKDDTAPTYQQAIDDAKKLLRYAVARWGYSTSVAVWEHFNENDPGLPTDRFYTATGEYLEKIDVYGHLRSTSTWHPSPKDCRHPKLDLADVHFYLRPADKGRLRDEVDAVLDRARYLREHAPRKPAILGEFGLANERWQPTREMNESGSLADFHNGLWASALSGTSGTCLFWWWDRLDRRNAYGHYRPLAAFLADVPWTTAGFKAASAAVSHEQARLVGLQGRDRAYLWLFNPQAAWSRVVIEKTVPEAIEGATVEIDGLAPAVYRVAWWDTWEGKTIKETKVAAPEGILRTTVPVFHRDVACKIVP